MYIHKIYKHTKTENAQVKNHCKKEQLCLSKFFFKSFSRACKLNFRDTEVFNKPNETKFVLHEYSKMRDANK